MFPTVLHLMVLLLKTAAVLSAVLFAAVSFAKESKSARNTPIIEQSFLTLKPERRDAYLDWIATDGAQCLEQLKRSGLVVDWRVHGAQTRAPDDPDVIVTVTYRDQAAFDALGATQDPALSQLTEMLHGADEMIARRRALTERSDF